VDFKNTVVIMTSNLGSHLLTERATEDTITEGVRREVMEIVRTHFRPEFLNRIDEVILFHPLGRTHLGSIVEIQARHLLKRLEDRKIHVELSAAAREMLVREGYDPAYGARPLKRTIQKLVLDPLARRVLESEFGEGDTVIIDADGGALVFRKAAAAAPA
jgi:ATP-dependent Clp protease ATP-binding subunit ClpB